MKRPTNPRRLTYSAAFRALDEVDFAQTDLNNTFAVLSSLIDADIEMAGSHMDAMERHLKTDYDALKAAIAKARKTILTSLHARRAYDDPPEEEAPALSEAEGPPSAEASALSLAVDNDGDAA